MKAGRGLLITAWQAGFSVDNWRRLAGDEKGRPKGANRGVQTGIRPLELGLYFA